MKKGGACFKEFGPFSLPAADLVPIEHCTGDVTNVGEAIGQTVWVFLHHETLLARGFFSLLSSHQRASSAGLPSATLLANLWSI